MFFSGLYRECKVVVASSQEIVVSTSPQNSYGWENTLNLWEAEFILIHSDFLPREIRTLVLGFNTTEVRLENRKTVSTDTEDRNAFCALSVPLSALSHISGRPRPWNWKLSTWKPPCSDSRKKSQDQPHLKGKDRVISLTTEWCHQVRQICNWISSPSDVKSFRLNSCYSKWQKNQLKMGKGSEQTVLQRR